MDFSWKTKPHGVRPPAEVQEGVARLVRERGVRAAAALLGVGRDSTARLAIGESVLNATLAVAAARLREGLLDTAA